MASQFGENSLRNSCLAFIQLNFNYLHRLNGVVGRVPVYHATGQEWVDIGYHFVIGGDGLVYEGRPWFKMGAHTKYHNRKSIGIAFLGDYDKDCPNPSMLDIIPKLVYCGVEKILSRVIIKDTKIKHKKSISLETKMQVIRRLDTGERESQIGAAFNLATSTIRIILENKEKILSSR
ncbi:peptidoglycan recognition protein [Trichonephila clavipes]|nr:peptidoglycan recognition protein [Trichonephila clavipes]